MNMNCLFILVNLDPLGKSNINEWNQNKLATAQTTTRFIVGYF
jgi:hypothetical protein